MILVCTISSQMVLFKYYVMKNVELIECDFLGEYDFEDYKISRDFIDGEGTHLRLYQTIFSPKEPAIATIVIVHGFGEHSGRFKHVA